MKMKAFAFICIFNGIFAMESEKEWEYRKETEKLMETVDFLKRRLSQRECEIKSLELILKCERLQKEADHDEKKEIGVMKNACFRPAKTFYEKQCSLCNGEILRDQLHIKLGRSHDSPVAHAICQAGFQGYECSFYKIPDQPIYKPFQKAVIRVFEKAGRFIDLRSAYVQKNLKIEGYDSKMVVDEHRVKTWIRELGHDIAYWIDYSGHHWAVHRKCYGEPKDVNWERYIIEILKRENFLPLVDFSYYSTEGKPIVPPKLLNFIEQYTKMPSFAAALMTFVPEVELLNVGEKCYMRLKRQENLRESLTPTDSKSSQTEWSAYDYVQNCQEIFNQKLDSLPNTCQDSSNFVYDPTNECQNFENVLTPVLTKPDNIDQSTNSLLSHRKYRNDKLDQQVPTKRYYESNPTNFYDPLNLNVFSYTPTDWSRSREYQTLFGEDFQKTKSSSGENSQKTNKLLSFQSQKEKPDSTDPFKFEENQFKE